jgi:hypothetical protein
MRAKEDGMPDVNGERPATGMRPPARPDLSPPWMLFVDKGRPVAILPAGRLGKVADVEKLTMQEAREIVRIANAIHHRLVLEELSGIERDMARK